MAKIYETQKDFEQDKLDEQSKGLHIKSGDEFIEGVGIGAVGSIASYFSKSRAVALLSSALNLVGIGFMIKSFFTRSKANDLELERDRLGPQHIVLPPDMPESDNLATVRSWFPTAASVNFVENQDNPPEKDCGCPHKHGPKSLLEHALTSSDPSLAK